MILADRDKWDTGLLVLAVILETAKTKNTDALFLSPTARNKNTGLLALAVTLEIAKTKKIALFLTPTATDRIPNCWHWVTLQIA